VQRDSGAAIGVADMVADILHGNNSSCLRVI